MNIGVIGLGFMGAAHLAGYAKVPGVKAAAICTNNPEVLAGDLSKIGGNIEFDAAAIDISGAKKYTRWQDLVADTGVDAVDICLPTDLHMEVSMAALKAGKHVLCEKPMALSNAECDQMVEAAEANKRVLMIGQVLRFWPEYVELQKFGPVRAVTFVRQCGLPDWSKWLPVEARSGGALLDLLIHDIDQALMLCGMPERVSAKRIGDSDSVMATLIYPGGPEVRIQGGWFAAGMPFKMAFQARGAKGELELNGDGLFLSDASGKKIKVEPASENAYSAEVAYFVDCCQKKVAPERCLPRDSAKAVKIALALKESRKKDGESQHVGA